MSGLKHLRDLPPQSTFWSCPTSNPCYESSQGQDLLTRVSDVTLPKRTLPPSNSNEGVFLSWELKLRDIEVKSQLMGHWKAMLDQAREAICGLKELKLQKSRNYKQWEGSWQRTDRADAEGVPFTCGSPAPSSRALASDSAVLGSCPWVSAWFLPMNFLNGFGENTVSCNNITLNLQQNYSVFKSMYSQVPVFSVFVFNYNKEVFCFCFCFSRKYDKKKNLSFYSLRY